MSEKQALTIIPPGGSVSQSVGPFVPRLIAELGEQACWRYVEFFTANIENSHTRRAYARACVRFFAWCDGQGLSLETIRPFDVSEYIMTLRKNQ